MPRAGYAADTRVPVDRSKGEIERLLIKHGAEGFHTGWQGTAGDTPGWDALEFLWKGKTIRFRLARAVGKRGQQAEQLDRQRWRILFLVIKAKLEAVEAGVVVFEEEFLPFIVMAGNKTVGEVLLPRLAAAGDKPLQLESGKG